MEGSAAFRLLEYGFSKRVIFSILFSTLDSNFFLLHCMYLCGLRDAAGGTGAVHPNEEVRLPPYCCERYVFVPRVLLKLDRKALIQTSFSRHDDPKQEMHMLYDRL